MNVARQITQNISFFNSDNNCFYFDICYGIIFNENTEHEFSHR